MVGESAGQRVGNYLFAGVKKHFRLVDKLLPAVGNNFLLIMAGARDPGKCRRAVRVAD